MNRNITCVLMGKKIKDIRVSKDMTQQDLAKRSGHEKANISRIESGRSNPTIVTVCKISDALEVNIIELFKD